MYSTSVQFSKRVRDTANSRVFFNQQRWAIFHRPALYEQATHPSNKLPSANLPLV